MIQSKDAPSYPLLRQRRSLKIFVWMIAVSLLLHGAASVIFILPGKFSQASAPPVFMELQNLAETPLPVESPVEKEIDDSQQLLPAPEAAPETAKLEKAVESSLRRAVQTPEAVHESSIGLGMISGHFASFAEGESLKSDIRVYYFELMRRVNEAWWTSGASKGIFANAAAVNLSISREGKIIACELLQSSGSREQDKALLDAVSKVGPLPSLPKSYLWPTFKAPIRFVPPLRLMLPGFTNKRQLVIQPGE